MEVLHISCNMCTQDLPDVYALSPRASGIHIRQIPCAHVTTYTYIHIYIYGDQKTLHIRPPMQPRTYPQVTRDDDWYTMHIRCSAWPVYKCLNIVCCILKFY